MFKCDQFSWSSQSSLWFKSLSFLIGPWKKVKFFYSFAQDLHLHIYHANLIAVHPVPKFTFRIQETFLTGPKSILWSGLSPPLPLKLPFILQSKIGLRLSPVHFFLSCPLLIFHFLEWSSYLICCLTHLDLGEKLVLLICLERWRAETGHVWLNYCFLLSFWGFTSLQQPRICSALSTETPSCQHMV